jgi:hypothetical protein
MTVAMNPMRSLWVAIGALTRRRFFPYPRNLIGCWVTVTWTNEIAIELRVYLSRD